MKNIRQSLFSRLLMGFMALYLFNISADAPDAYPAYVPENLAINDMESIAELLLEGVLNIENAVPEQDDPDRDDDASKFQKLTVFMPGQTSFSFEQFLETGANNRPQNSRMFLAGICPDITSPPPQC